jgi:CheY-like chemotaxis protein
MENKINTLENRNVLLVEDNEGDIILTIEALKELDFKINVSVARDGEEALYFLKKEAEFADAPTPTLVLLDINLPKIDGKQVLSYIKSTATLKHIPVIMLTTSSSQLDINEAYNNHANCYLTKPVNLENFFALVTSLQKHWLNIVKLPTN